MTNENIYLKITFEFFCVFRVVKMYYSFQDPINLYLIMEFLPGGTFPFLKFQVRLMELSVNLEDGLID